MIRAVILNVCITKTAYLPLIGTISPLRSVEGNLKRIEKEPVD